MMKFKVVRDGHSISWTWPELFILVAWGDKFIGTRRSAVFLREIHYKKMDYGHLALISTRYFGLHVEVG